MTQLKSTSLLSNRCPLNVSLGVLNSVVRQLKRKSSFRKLSSDLRVIWEGNEVDDPLQEGFKRPADIQDIERGERVLDTEVEEETKTHKSQVSKRPRLKNGELALTMNFGHSRRCCLNLRIQDCESVVGGSEG